MKRIIERVVLGLFLLLMLFIWLMGTVVSITDYFETYQNEPQTLTLQETIQLLPMQQRVWANITDPIWFCETLEQIKGYRSRSTKVIFTDQFGEDIVFADFDDLYTCEQLQAKTADGTLSIIKNPPDQTLRMSQFLAKKPGKILSLCGHCDRQYNILGVVFLAIIFPIAVGGIIAYNMKLDKQKKQQLDENANSKQTLNQN